MKKLILIFIFSILFVIGCTDEIDRTVRKIEKDVKNGIAVHIRLEDFHQPNSPQCGNGVCID